MVALIAFGAKRAKRARLTGKRWAKPMLLMTWKQTGQNSPIFWPEPSVALEHAAPEHEAKEREEERRFDRHEEMACCHGQRAEQDGAAPAEEAIGEKAAEDRSQVNARGIGAEDRGSERLAIEPAVELAVAIEGYDVLDAAGVQEILDHVEDKQGLHAVVGETFPCLCEGEIPKPARVAEKLWLENFAAQWHGIIRFGHGGHSGSDESAVTSDKSYLERECRTRRLVT